MKVVMFGNYAIYFIPRLIAFSNKLKREGGKLLILQAREENMLYGKLPQVETAELNIAHIWDAPESLNYRQKAFFMLDKLNPDVVVTGFVSFPFGAAGLAWAKSRNRGVIEYDDQREGTFARGRLNKWVKRHLLKHVDAFLCPAPAWDDTFIGYGFKKEQIYYGLNSSDNEFWSKRVENKSFVELPSSYFMTLGRQVKMKNLGFLIKAYKKYRAHGGKVPLVLVGEGPEHSNLVQIADNMDNIYFIGFQTREKIRELFSNMKALILPSFKQETWGMVANECMASGNIVAVSIEAGCSTTIVKDSLNGFHFSPYNEKELEDVLFKIENLSPEKEAEMKQSSIDIVKDWGVDRFVDGLYAACKFAINNKQKECNPIDHMLIKFWRGRYNFSEAT